MKLFCTNLVLFLKRIPMSLCCMETFCCDPEGAFVTPLEQWSVHVRPKHKYIHIHTYILHSISMFTNTRELGQKMSYLTVKEILKPRCLKQSYCENTYPASSNRDCLANPRHVIRQMSRSKISSRRYVNHLKETGAK